MFKIHPYICNVYTHVVRTIVSARFFLCCKAELTLRRPLSQPLTVGSLFARVQAGLFRVHLSH